MSIAENVPAPDDEVPQSNDVGSRVNGFHLEPRCRVCRNDRVRTHVNDLLAAGSTYAGILRALGDVNAGLDPRDRVTIDSIRNHSNLHFPVQNAARATYRDILEHRAQENGRDFVNGLVTAITPMAFLETVVAKGYATLVDPATTVDVRTTITAASRLQELTDSRSGQSDLARAMVEMNRVIELVQNFVPRDRWPALQAALKGEPVAIEGAPAPDETPKARMIPIDDGDDEADERWHG